MFSERFSGFEKVFERFLEVLSGFGVVLEKGFRWFLEVFRRVQGGP